MTNAVFPNDPGHLRARRDLFWETRSRPLLQLVHDADRCLICARQDHRRASPLQGGRISKRPTSYPNQQRRFLINTADGFALFAAVTWGREEFRANSNVFMTSTCPGPQSAHKVIKFCSMSLLTGEAWQDFHWLWCAYFLLQTGRCQLLEVTDIERVNTFYRASCRAAQQQSVVNFSPRSIRCLPWCSVPPDSPLCRGIRPQNAVGCSG